MDIHVSEQGLTMPDGRVVKCAIGRGGIHKTKREGDGVTPVGDWPLRYGYYRADRLGTAPQTHLSMTPIQPDDGWCDAPDDANYNKAVKKPYAASHEDMWREDELYDIVVVLGHNDDPPVPGNGSAIFLHVARPGYKPTEGCVALPRETLVELLNACKAGDRMAIRSLENDD